MLSADALMILGHERIAELRREAEADRLVQLAQTRASNDAAVALSRSRAPRQGRGRTEFRQEWKISMRRVVATEYVTLDGVTQDPGWRRRHRAGRLDRAVLE